jgi:serine/threonine-protein kinase HipA
MKLNVYLNLYGKRQMLGILSEVDNGRHIYFQYSPDFLNTGVQLSPFKLPLKNGVFEEIDRVFDGLFGLFNDSLPDGWGCLLLDRKLMKSGLSYNSITPLQRLSMIGKNPMGALEYEPAQDSDEVIESIELDSLSIEADKVLAGHPTDVLDRLLSLNGSSGGARPKIVVNVSGDKSIVRHGSTICSDDFEPWIIKFSNGADRKDLGLQEYVYSIMARNAGIDMPETFLFPSSNSSGHFGVKRFDRIGNKKVHVHTACGLLHASHRISSIDYETLLKLTQILTNSREEVLKMVRLMIFNVKSGNKDDHSKNFSFLLDENIRWKLAPAYDLTPLMGINGEQTSMVNGKGLGITDEDFIVVASKVGIKRDEVVYLIEQVDAALTDKDKIIKQVAG